LGKREWGKARRRREGDRGWKERQVSGKRG
jgi:hypothetical protein